ncbi:ADP-ribose pyrophosphatase [Micromonospora haikouensis]|uniref:ADP-ribose pyrophosphatase n=1 Tax=Micromonospora haikouensis TaxID=686309 RepID=A0A1C4VYH3_9ACTN|nr:NUDIX hydrolase [Micromonospora haikouensis]SCE89007.1 ADP-ribose pyrophosphatase [Micromonospora haikouensis]
MNGSPDRSRYQDLRAQLPELFDNPPDAAVKILDDPTDVAAAERAKAEELAAQGLPMEWSRTGVAYQDQYLTLVREPVRFPDGTFGTYIRSFPAGGASGVVLLPVLNGAVVLVEHFRHATRRWHLEAPRGFGVPGVPADEQALLELQEEIAAELVSLIDLGLFHPDTGTSTNEVRLYLVEIAAVGAPQTGEGIRAVHTCTPAEVGKLVRDGVITDSFTIAAWTRAWLRGLLPGTGPQLEPE